MSGTPSAAHPGVMTTGLEQDNPTAAPRLFFLVELRAAMGPPTDLHRMQQDLARSIARLRAGGVAIEQADSLVLPEDARCLCLLWAADKASVALACDAAGLTAAPVYEIHRPGHTSTSTIDHTQQESP